MIIISDNSVISAKEKELQSWRDNEVYCEVEDKGQSYISTRWIILLMEKM